MPTLKEIMSKEEQDLRTLLRTEDVLEDVEKGVSIVILEGRSIIDLGLKVKKGEKLAVIPLGALFGG